MASYKNVKSKLRNVSLIAVFGLILLSVIPIMFGSSSTNIQPALGQREDPFPVFSNETLTPAQRTAREQLLKQEGFSVNVMARNLSAPFNILYGPDDTLWITERTGKNITRIDPINGTKLSTHLSPTFTSLQVRTVFWEWRLTPTSITHTIFTLPIRMMRTPVRNQIASTKITRFTYDPTTNTISEPLDLINGLSGSSDHNSGRMTFGPDGKLYYTIGDQGKNQLALACLNNQAQHLPTADQVAAKNWTAYEGKVLRLNPDGSIPEDNPEINGVKSHVYTYGHRNAQGIAVGPNGDLYVAEHGDNSDDEINRLQAGGNYGWPYVSGYIDNKAYQFYNWSAAENCEDLTFNDVAPAPPGVPVINESQFNASNFVPPIHTFYTVENDFNFTNQARTCGKMTSVCYPTVAPSSLASVHIKCYSRMGE